MTPTKCQWCGEWIEDSDNNAHIKGTSMHGECAVRSMIGSVGHLMKLCSCYVPGSTVDDPPFTTRRQSAKLANMLWRFQAETKRAEDSFLARGKRLAQQKQSSDECDHTNHPLRDLRCDEKGHAHK